ncbi:hypothetical protein BIY23_03925 [Wolbachia pipientis]|uniref:DUF2188 domain-containing protein n=1 Tax=Wolbachia pipientis TaxID=955 RepID=A0A1E7QIY8_WOLPI|nr:DUF2188 domain-containing protein [Wolbachia pipientis]OEY86438.1 hypothetical protein BIY23_03925 [Wolbachia pipientis]
MSNHYFLSYHVVYDQDKWHVKEVKEKEIDALSNKEDAIKRAQDLANNVDSECVVKVSDDQGVIKKGVKKVADKINRVYTKAKEELKS